jgi:hypothetical protein
MATIELLLAGLPPATAMLQHASLKRAEPARSNTMGPALPIVQAQREGAIQQLLSICSLIQCETTKIDRTHTQALDVRARCSATATS